MHDTNGLRAGGHLHALDCYVSYLRPVGLHRIGVKKADQTKYRKTVDCDLVPAETTLVSPVPESSNQKFKGVEINKENQYKEDRNSQILRPPMGEMDWLTPL